MNQLVLVERIVESVLSLDGDAVAGLIRSAVEQNLDLATGLNGGLTEGLCELGAGSAREEVFVSELTMGAEIVQLSLKELEPHIETDNLSTRGTFLIGTVAGDLHDAGKGIVFGGPPALTDWASATNADACAVGQKQKPALR